MVLHVDVPRYGRAERERADRIADSLFPNRVGCRATWPNRALSYAVKAVSYSIAPGLAPRIRSGAHCRGKDR